jgi:hypothetical protein
MLQVDRFKFLVDAVQFLYLHSGCICYEAKKNEALCHVITLFQSQARHVTMTVCVSLACAGGWTLVCGWAASSYMRLAAIEAP